MSVGVRILFVVVVALSGVVHASVEYEAVYLWPDGAPGAIGDAETDKPRLMIHPAPESVATGAAMIVNPGGGYRGLAADHEGLQVAQMLNEAGITAFVLRYRLLPDYQPSTALLDGQRAVRLVRHRAKEFEIDPARIGMMGFSAGGHLTTAVATANCEGDPDAVDPIDRESARPDFVAPVYAAVSPELLKFEMGDWASTEKLVTEKTPPTFLVHTHEDALVTPLHSVRFYEALVEAGIPAELHIFQRGQHGLGLAPQDADFGKWPSLLVAWIKRGGWLTDSPRIPVSGRATIDGEAVYWGAVSFIPEDNRLPAAMANIDRGKNGQFSVSAPHAPAAGVYRVEVHLFTLDWSDIKQGKYSLSKAMRWTLPDPVEIREGIEPFQFDVSGKQ